ncbi:MAG: CvpA family protein [Clostridia bacterium]|nr:CvpA family protein [Clostridia bacterium]
MSAVLDIVLIAIVVVFAIIGAKKGFFLAVSGFASHFVGLLVAVLFYKPFAALIKKLPFLANMITEVEMPDLDTGEGLMENFKVIMEYIVTNEDIGGTTEAIINNLIADVISIAIAFILLFVGASLLTKLVFRILNFAAKMPVLKQINGTLGAVMGVCTGLFWSWMFALVFGGLLFPICNENWPNIFADDMLESFIFKLCSEFNPIAFIANLLQKLL